MGAMKEHAIKWSDVYRAVTINDGYGLKKTPAKKAPKVEQKGESNMDILYTEDRKLAQEAFDMSQCHGTAAVADKFEWYNNKGVELPLVDIETRIENNLDKIDAIEGELSRLEASTQGLVGEKAPPWVVKREQKQIEYLSERKEYFIKTTKEAVFDTDTKLAAEEIETLVDNDPFHWKQAKAYWERILTFVCRNKLSRAKMVDLYTKVCLAKQKGSISSWYFFQLAYHCARELNMTKERIKLLNYAIKCKSAPFEGSMWSRPQEDPTLRIQAREVEFWTREFNPDGLLEIQRGEDLTFILPDGSYLPGSCIQVKYVLNNGEVV